MAKTISSLGIELYANSARLTKDLQKSRKNTKRWARDVKKSAKAALKTFAVGGTLAAGALTVLTKESLKNLDSLGKLSDRYNINTKDLAALRHQAELSGTSYQTLDKSIGKMVKSIGEASQGTGEAIRYAKLLNINLEEIKNLDAGAQYEIIAEKISGLKNATDKAAAANAFFGRSGIDMLNQLNQGAEGFKAAREEAEALGLSVSRVDTRQIEEANDSITRMKRVTTGLGNTIAVKVAPFITAIAENFFNASKESRGFSDQVRTGMDIAALSIAKIGLALQVMGKGFAVIEAAIISSQGIAEKAGKKAAANSLILPLLAQTKSVTETYKIIRKTYQEIENAPSIGEKEAKRLEEIAKILNAPLDFDKKFLEKMAVIEAEALKRAQQREKDFQGNGGGTAPVDPQELESLRKLVASKIEIANQEYTAIKQRAEIVFEDEKERNAALLELKKQHQERIGQISGIPALEKELEQARAARQQATMSQAEFDRITEQTRHAERLANLQLLYEQEGLSRNLYFEGKEIAESLHHERLLDIQRQAAEARKSVEQDVANSVLQLRQSVQNKSIGLMRSLSQQSKGFAIAAIVLEKAMAIKSIIVQSRMQAAKIKAAAPVAGALAYASQLIPGDPTSLARAVAARAATIASFTASAASTIALGNVSAVLSGISGALELSNVGGGGSDFGTPNNSSFTGSNLLDEDQTQGAGTGKVTQIIFNGDFSGVNERTALDIADLIKDAINGQDYVLIEGNTAQASEIIQG